MESTLARAFALALALPAAPLAAFSDTFVIPHVLEQSGKITNTQFTFDTSIFMTLPPNPAAPGATATVQIHVYDDATGLPLESATRQVVCNPCAATLGPGGAGQAPPQMEFVIDDAIVAAGGFPRPSLSLFLVLTRAPGEPPVDVRVATQSALTGPDDLGGVWVHDAPCPGGGGGGGGGATTRTFVVPHILEKSGRISNTPHTFDTSIFMTYTAGLAGAPAGPGATASLYLHAPDGSLLQSASGADVCAPCTWSLGDGAAAPRKVAVHLEDLLVAAGGVPAAGIKLGHGVIVVSGDNDNVRLTSEVVNSKSGPLDLAVFVFEPQPLSAAPSAHVGPDVPGLVRALRIAPVPSAGAVELGFTLERGGDVALEVLDPQGRRIAEPLAGAREPGVHVVRWDARDAAGRPLEPGVYFARVRAADGSTLTRPIVLRR